MIFKVQGPECILYYDETPRKKIQGSNWKKNA